MRFDVGAGLLVLNKLPSSHPLLADGEHVGGGSITAPALDVGAGIERGFGSGWTAMGSLRAGAAYGGDPIGGALLSCVVLIGIGHGL